MIRALALELWDAVFGREIRKSKDRELKRKEKEKKRKERLIKKQAEKLEQSKIYIEYLKRKRERTERRIRELQKKLALESTARIVEREMGIESIPENPY